MIFGFLEVLLLSTALLVPLYYLKIKSKTKNSRFPPGPTPLPIIGNLHQLGRDPLKTFVKWAQKFGPIYSFKIGGEDTIIISDHNMLKALLSEEVSTGRATDNPVLSAFSDNSGVINSDGPTWEEQRRFTVRKLRQIGLLKSSVESKLLEEVKSLLHVFQRNDGKLLSMNRMFNGPVVNTLWSIVSGERHEWDAPVQPEILKRAEDLLHAIDRIATTGLIFAPFLRHIMPKFVGWTDWVNSIANLKKLMNVTVANHTENHDTNNPQDFVDHYLAQMKSEENPSSSFYKEKGADNLFAVVADLFMAGSETSANAICWALLQLSQDQERQKKMQNELDKLLGSPESGSRLPSLTDRPLLPYTEAVIMEVLRLHPVLPLGVPHRIKADMEFQGHFLPKNANIWGNIYGIHHDQNVWEGQDVEKFRPERFLNEDETKVVQHEAFIPFEVGRRKCIGESLAKDTLLLFIASIFHKFSVEPDPKCPKADFEPIIGFIMKPKPFNVVLKVRNN